MACFNKKINNCSKLDWRILMNGSISLYFSKDILEKDMIRLSALGYQLKEFDFSIIKTREEFHSKAKKEFEFPEYYGENLAAFSDSLMSDLFIPEIGGVAVVFKGFDEYLEKDKEYANEILDRLELNARRRMLFGECFLTLVQTGNKNITIEDVGAHSIVWNLKESM